MLTTEQLQNYFDSLARSEEARRHHTLTRQANPPRVVQSGPRKRLGSIRQQKMGLTIQAETFSSLSRALAR